MMSMVILFLIPVFVFLNLQYATSAAVANSRNVPVGITESVRELYTKIGTW